MATITPLASTSSSTSAPTNPTQPSRTILLFARGVIALLDLWPALTIAVAEQWGGRESAEKKTWMASVIVDEFESRAVYLPTSTTAGAGSSNAGSSDLPPQVDPKTANDPPLDQDDLGDLIHQMMSDEFDANIEDDSIDGVTADILRLWRDVLQPQLRKSESGVGAQGGGMQVDEVEVTPDMIVEALERKAGEVKKRGVNASKGQGPDVDMDGIADADAGEGDWTDSSDDDGDEGDEYGDEAPQLVNSGKEKEKQEPVIDEDGFELVQKGRRR